jgi:hypothetical protein
MASIPAAARTPSRRRMKGAVNGSASSGAAPRVPPGGNALYVYGIVRTGTDLEITTAGLDDRWPVRTIEHNGLAAVVSEVTSGTPASTRGNLLAHERVNAAVLENRTVVPMSFGTVFRSRADVVELLRTAHDAFDDVLDKMHDKREFGLKVFWDREAMIASIARQDDEIRILREEITGRLETGLASRLEYGCLVDAALARHAEERVTEILDRLRDVCVASRTNPAVGDRMVLNAAFLVERGQEQAFDRCVQAIAGDHAELTFQYTGPWPPYNFVAIRLKVGQP